MKNAHNIAFIFAFVAALVLSAKYSLDIHAY